MLDLTGDHDLPKKCSLKRIVVVHLRREHPDDFDCGRLLVPQCAIDIGEATNAMRFRIAAGDPIYPVRWREGPELHDSMQKHFQELPALVCVNIFTVQLLVVTIN